MVAAPPTAIIVIGFDMVRVSRLELALIEIVPLASTAFTP